MSAGAGDRLTVKSSFSSCLIRRSDSGSVIREDLPSLSELSQDVFASPAKAKTAKNEDDGDGRRRRHGASKWDSCLEAEVRSEDTLRSLSLRYNVPTAELKRLNNLINENELHALKTVRLPVGRLSLLAEELQEDNRLLAGVHGGSSENVKKDANGWLVENFTTPPTGATSSATVDSSVSSPAPSELSRDEDICSSDSPNSQTSFKVPLSKEVRKANKLFKSVDRELESIRQKSDPGIKSTRIVNLTELKAVNVISDWEGLSDHFLEDGEDESEDDLLLPSTGGQSNRYAKYRAVANHAMSKWVCLFCVLLIGISVVVILLFADYEYQSIEHKAHHESNISPMNKTEPS